MNNFLTFSIRVIIVFYFTYLSTRALTKKAMAQMTAYEVAGLMILANVAAEPLVDKVTVKSVYGVGLLVLLMFISSKLALKNKLTSILEHTPTIIVNKGKLDMKALNNLGLSLNQLEGLLRQKGYDKISDLDTVVMEPQGNISVFPKSENKPVTLKDINIKTYTQGITIPLIMDGNIIYNNLKHIQRTKDWLLQELYKQGILDYKNEVGIAELDTNWKLNVLKK
jgi:uncharacterized membrane protein YcaP (DUF421 family)